MREILHAELLIQGLDTVVSGEGRWPEEVRRTMELEYEVALREHGPLAVMWITIDDLERHARASGAPEDLLLASLTAALRVLLHEGDVLAYKEGTAILVVLPRARQEPTEALARRLVEAAKRLPVPSLERPMVASVSIGLAFARYDAAYWFDTLREVAKDGAVVASSGGGSATVHTELYSFHQRRLERLHPEREKPVLPPAPSAKPDPVAKAKAPAASAGAVAAVAAPRELPAATSVTAVPASRQNVQDLEEKVLRLAKEWAQEALAKALAEQKREHFSQVDLLERRIQKLMRSLEEAQVDLERAQGGAETDSGIASTFRAVQGLRGGPDVAAKLDMLAKLVEMNLALRAQFSTRA
jgi:GGDEF domain-containing protein